MLVLLKIFKALSLVCNSCKEDARDFLKYLNFWNVINGIILRNKKYRILSFIGNLLRYDKALFFCKAYLD